MNTADTDWIDIYEREWCRRGLSGASLMATATTLLQVHAEIVRRLTDALRPHRLSVGRYLVLALLFSGPDPTLPISQVAELLMVPAASMTHTIDRLEQEGTVRRRPSSDDRRTVLVELTDGGRDLAAGAIESVVQARYGLPYLSEEQLMVTRAALDHVRVRPSEGI